MMSAPVKVLFLDRDKTINEDPGYLGNPDQVKLLPGVGESIALLQRFGFVPIVVSNQSGIARGYFSSDAADAVNRKINELLSKFGASIARFYYCPHQDEDDCDCRKPRDGLFHQASRDFHIDWARSWMIGDSLRDIQAAESMGIPGILLSQEPPNESPSNLVFVAPDFTTAAHVILERLYDASFAEKCFQASDRKGLIQWKRTHPEKKVVFTNGCFDILHPGHLQILYQASRLGDVLVVGINSDESVKRLKGETRPVNSVADRMLMLANLSYVAFVSEFVEDTPEEIIRELRPEVHVKGGDYREEDLPEAEIVRSYGGEVVILPYRQGYSTTKLIEKIHDRG